MLVIVTHNKSKELTCPILT